ncbi:hypothetical protein GCM10022258_13150 [Aquimarina gracilis]
MTSLNNHSIKYNEKHGISGSLVFYKRKFVGILEGEENNVKRLYQKIKKDSMHTKVSVLAKGFVWERQFTQWNMMYYLPKSNTSSHLEENFFSSNILNLVLLVDKKTYASQIFWGSVRDMFS